MAVELSKSHFRLISSGSYDHLAVYTKSEMPIMYIVSVVDFDNVDMDKYQNVIFNLSNNILADNEKFLKNIVCVNILYSEGEETKTFADEAELLRQNGVHNIWWSTDGKELFIGRNQPDKIYGIEKCVLSAIGTDESIKEKNIRDISQKVYEDSLLKTSDKFPVFTMAIISANVFIFLIQVIFGGTYSFIEQYGINRDLVFNQGQYFRLFTYMFIHGGIEHILSNMIFVFIYGVRFEKYCGIKNTALIYFVSGILGALLSLAADGSGFSVGASGAIFGLLGAFLVVAKKTKQNLGGIGYITILAVVVMGIGMGMLDSAVDNYGHIGGLLSGIIIQYLIYRPKKNNGGNN